MERKMTIPASYLVLEKDNKILLLRRFNTGYEDGKYSLIAGHLEDDESLTQCIIREAKEEAGITVNEEDLRVEYVLHRNSGLEKNNQRIDVFFTTNKWIGKIENKEKDKCDNLSWFSKDQLPKNIIPYIKDSINKINNKINYGESGW